MALVLSEDAQLVRDQALDFFREKSPILALRKLRDSADPTGFSRELWREMADLGWTGFLVSEDAGGSGFGMVGLGQVLEAAGRTLAASPLISTALIGASALDIAGTPAQKSAYLTSLLSGDTITALASEEGSHHNPAAVAATARPSADGWVLDGRKTFVLDGHVATLLIVSARTAAGITLFLVPAATQGVTITRRLMADSRNATLNLASSEGVQMHGGIGMTDEHEIGFFLKRSRVAEITFGSTGFHRDRYAALNGY